MAYREGKFDAEKAVYMLDKYRVRNTFIWPTALKMMRQVKDLKTKYSLIIRSISSGGEAVGEEVIKWAEADLGVTINEFFGQTEINYVTGNCSAIMKVKAGSMGKQYPGHTVDLIDDKGNFVKSGEIGEVVVKRHHPVMFLGYWQNEKATQEKILGDWWRMGDLAIRDADGYYWFQGRNDDIIGSAGYRIGPSEIENALLKHQIGRAHV